MFTARPGSEGSHARHAHVAARVETPSARGCALLSNVSFASFASDPHPSAGARLSRICKRARRRRYFTLPCCGHSENPFVRARRVVRYDPPRRPMSHYTIEFLLACLYLLLGPGAWVAFGFAMVKGRKRMRLLSRPRPAMPEPPPKVSVLVPAKDEEARVARCVATILAQDYSNFELVAIDDRSCDGTGRILDELAARDPRVRVVHVRPGELPAGWG